jgi:hypothetical protein
VTDTALLDLAAKIASSDAIWWATRFVLAVIVLLVAARTVMRIVENFSLWAYVKVSGYVHTYDVVSLRDGREWKVEKIRVRGVVLTREGQIKLIPLPTWVSMEVIVIVQRPRNGGVVKDG